jgi:hypothetical protein
LSVSTTLCLFSPFSLRRRGPRPYDIEGGGLDGAPGTIDAVALRVLPAAFACQFDWGKQTKTPLQDALRSVRAGSLQSVDVIDRYAEIDAYSQNELPDRALDDTDRNMGKNDV